MAHTKEEYAEARKQKVALFNLLLKKNGLKKQDLYDMVMQEYIVDNLSKLTSKEKKMFDALVF